MNRNELLIGRIDERPMITLAHRRSKGKPLTLDLLTVICHMIIVSSKPREMKHLSSER